MVTVRFVTELFRVVKVRLGVRCVVRLVVRCDCCVVGAGVMLEPVGFSGSVGVVGSSGVGLISLPVGFSSG